MQCSSYGLSDVGLKRTVKEDSFLGIDEIGFYIVADGVGGQAKGEVASAQAVEEAYGYVKRERENLARYLQLPVEDAMFKIRRVVESAIQSACYMVFGFAEQNPDSRGMSTTVSALLITEKFGVVAQVGDSRVYRLRSNVAEQLTEDHTLVNYRLKMGLITPEQAKTAPGKNVITRAVGHYDYVQVDTLTCDLRPKDRYMLCSDGLHTYLEDSEVVNYLSINPLEDAAKELIGLANNRGGKDNITVLLVDLL